jgi:LPXTG-motif cell wall-anchored protein
MLAQPALLPRTGTKTDRTTVVVLAVAILVGLALLRLRRVIR